MKELHHFISREDLFARSDRFDAAAWGVFYRQRGGILGENLEEFFQGDRNGGLKIVAGLISGTFRSLFGFSPRNGEDGGGGVYLSVLGEKLPPCVGDRLL